MSNEDSFSNLNFSKKQLLVSVEGIVLKKLIVSPLNQTDKLKNFCNFCLPIESK